MDDVLRAILVRVELPDDQIIFAAHEAAAWPRGTLAWLTKLGILRKAAPAEEVLCDGCEERCLIKPDIRVDPRTDKRVGKYFCGREETGGYITVPLDRMKQWAFSLAGLAAVVARSVGAAGKPVECESGRLVMLGTAKIDGKTRELFLARGAAWQDASQIFGNCARLKMASHAAVLTLAATPTEPLLAGCELAVRPLTEIADLQKGKLTVALNGVFPETKPGPWASIPNEPIALDQFMVKYCEVRTRNLRRSRRNALLGAARNQTVRLPPLASRHKSGQSNKYFIHDLLKAWQGYQDENLDLPPLLPQYCTSLPQELSPAAVR